MSKETERALKEILDKYFPNAEKNSETNATLLRQIIHHGNFVERVPKNVQNEAKKALRILENIKTDRHFEGKNIKKAITHLKIITDAKALHGRQHTSSYREKVALADFLFQLWTRHTGSTPPTTWQEDTHRYSKFLDDILNIIQPDWTARSVMEALRDHQK